MSLNQLYARRRIVCHTSKDTLYSKKEKINNTELKLKYYFLYYARATTTIKGKKRGTKR